MTRKQTDGGAAFPRPQAETSLGGNFEQDASLESSEAVLLRGPESIHEAEAIVEALGRVREKMASLQGKEGGKS